MLPAAEPDSARFGSDAFYSAIGRAFVALCAFVPLLFLVQLIDNLTGQVLQRDGGIQPHVVQGLDGVVLAPFLHANFEHVMANSVPLILLGTFVLAAGARRFLAATAFIAVVSGAGVWLIGDPRTVVVGASGVIFGYFGLLVVRGVVERSWWNIAVALLIGLLYGWQLVGVLPVVDSNISWQGHLCGLVAGMIAAVLFRRRRSGAPVAETSTGDERTLPVS
ncbi:rhomboid family intramembrane serine protease [Planosporangium mesophilum]|uniref:Rhomboid family intramembrane serine protease n=1 Tax=Planosporangium mesophilum TaxID=689768 RepID=A0A8J3WZ21_9ACTN|nr:rhomboid family intramembrane serine protease [Planosporangium mesophilum]NJC81209.1 rhomboid family intramembrane serine protease [Planosporangium mesophilum]GII21141.1 rhomboid family intramembrane serine protease [Planosporangium mesophilum]